VLSLPTVSRAPAIKKGKPSGSRALERLVRKYEVFSLQGGGEDEIGVLL
jgi:hypothetical protein